MPPTWTHRLPPQPGELLDRDRPLSFSWDGRSHVGFAGDTIVSALAASGTRVLSRSLKYHRPRGVLTASFTDPGCTVQVGAEPNVRAGHRRLRAGMRVEPQNVWPSLRYDVGSVNQLVGRFLSAGFYYKTFMAPQRLWPTYERVLERFAAGGRLGDETDLGSYDQCYAHPDVVVAGGGPAGIGAALAAADAGAQVMLVEEEYELGGHLRWGGPTELAVLRDLRSAAQAHPGVEVCLNSVVLGRYDDNWVSIVRREHDGVTERLVRARAAALVVAPGLIERPYVFEGNDLPGVLLGTAVRRLVNLYAVRPGDRAVALVANAEGDAAVADLTRAGVEVARVVDARAGQDLRRAVGSGGLTAVELSDGTRVDCDLLVVSTGWTAPTSLLNMAGDIPVYDPASARFRPGGGLPASVLAAGGIVGDGNTEELVEHGRAVGAAAATQAGLGSAPVPSPLPTRAHPVLFRAATHGFVDLSEDVSSADILAAAAEGYDSSELVKRYTTATMGPSQGKLETVNTVAVLAEAVGGSLESLGTTVWRPPYAPVTLGALAGRRMQPVRRSPMHEWHSRHGADWLVAGQWLRPDHYGDAEVEVRAVREGVGVIDVTPLGKLDLRGPDVPRLLEAAYVNRWSTLAVGSVRYGVMCAEDGVVLDDGVTGRLADDRYLMSTTSSGAARVWEHLEELLQIEHPDWRVHITPLTTAYASINVAGPRSRELMSRLTEGIDLADFGYMRVRTGRVAGVDDCFMWRIGFTGELSFEVHVPASYGQHVWDALLCHGGDLGVSAFGVEAQRILRLEKGHLVVGQDTDGLTDPFEAGLGALVKLDKDDFVGRCELTRRQESRRRVLVGLRPEPADVVPPEASLIHSGGDVVGRITSSRMSPTLGRCVALGYVPVELSEAGTSVTVVLPDGRRLKAEVTATLAQVDPEGVRLRV